MVSYPIDKYIHDAAWRQVLENYWLKDEFQMLLERVEKRSEEVLVYPPAKLRFEAFNTCPYQDLKVLILGQDPYHGPGQAHGLSFSVPDGQKLPPSLRNIFKELKSDLDIEPALSGNLSNWAKQGVLLLNSALTVEEAQAGSHQNWGWEAFTDFVIQSLSDYKPSMVFVLWGNWAKQKAKLIDGRHKIISSAHPSPLSARHGFMGSKPFSQINHFLEGEGLEPINWQLPW